MTDRHQLFRRHAFLEAVLRQAASPIVAVDASGTVVFVNDAARRLAGIDAATEPEGTHIELALPRWQRSYDSAGRPIAFEERLIPRALRGETIAGAEMRFFRDDGSACDILVSVTPVRDAEGAVIGVVSTSVDISDRRKAEEKFRSLLESAPDGIVIVEEDGRIVLVNAQMEELFGYRREELIGKPVEMLVPEPLRQEHHVQRAGYFRDPRSRPMGAGLALHGLRKDGTTFPVEISLSPLRTVEGVLVSAAIRNVSERRRAEETLRQSEERFRRIFDEGPLGVVLLNPEGTPQRINGTLCRMLGYSMEELMRRSIADVTHPDDLEADTRQWGRLLAGDIPSYQIEKRFLTKTGEVAWGSLTVSVVRDAEGRPLYGLGIVDDVTERKRAEEEIHRLATIVEAADDAILSTALGRDGRPVVVSWNRGAERLFGYSAEEVHGREISFLYPPQRLHELHELLDRLRRGEALVHYDTVRLAKDGRGVEVSVSVSPLKAPDGRVVGTAAILHDISYRKRVERELAKKAQELARSNADLEQFAYLASHDLQEPVRMVASYMQLLADEHAAKLDPAARECVDFALEGAKRMQALIRDALEYSRVGREKTAHEPTDCRDVLELAEANLRAAIQETGATITAAPLPVVMGNRSELLRLFQNLLGNAIKFHGDSPPRIHVAAELGNEVWTLSVRDDGIGIDSQDFERIFQMFQRLHGHETYPGTGVGLALCRKIVEQHGGRIWVESTPGRGSIFRFTLPAVSEE